MTQEEFWWSTPWQFAAAVNGWNKSQGGGDKPPPMSDATYEALLAEIGD